MNSDKNYKNSAVAANNDMNVFTDSEDESADIPRATMCQYNANTSLHSSQLANSMSFSDSDSDFESESFKRNKLSLLCQTNQIASTFKFKKSTKATRKRITQNHSSQCLFFKKYKLRTEEIPSTYKSKFLKNKPINNIINYKVVKISKFNISEDDNNKRNKSKRKLPEVGNLFKPMFTSTEQEKQNNKDNKIPKKNCTTIHNDQICVVRERPKINQESNEPSSSCNLTDNRKTNESSISNNHLKHLHNVPTQTDISDISNNDEIQPVSNKTVQRNVSSKSIKNDSLCGCPFLLLRSNHINKEKVTEANITYHLNEKCSIQRKVAQKRKTTCSVKMLRNNSSSKSTMKQLKITDLNFCKDISDKNISHTTSNKYPLKSDNDINKSNKISEKKETRYSQENHKTVYENVKKICQWVFGNEYFCILFIKSEIDLLKKLFDLPDQRYSVICIRLFTRQYKWYNLQHLCEELNLIYDGFNVQECFSSITSGFVSSDYSEETIENLLNYLPLLHIKDICQFFKIKARSSKKQELIKKLLKYSAQQCTLTSLKRTDQILKERIFEKLGICVKLNLNVKDILFRVHLLYSLTSPDFKSPNDIYKIMINIQKEIVKYPKVKIDSVQLFFDRQDFLNYAEACLLKSELNCQIDEKNFRSACFICMEAHQRFLNIIKNEKQLTLDKKKPLFLRRFSAGWLYCKILCVGSQNLGKSFPEDVCKWLTDLIKQDIYCIQNRGQWYSQLALVRRAHLKDVVGEMKAIIDGLADKYVNEVQKYDLSIRGSKITRRKISNLLFDDLKCSLLPEIEIPVSRTIQANAVHNNEPGQKLYFVRTTAEGKEYNSVEQTAINYYKKEYNYTDGIHCEGQLLNGLFIILVWDILFEIHVPNTFITEVQTYPLDLFSGEFYENRNKELNARLKNIRDDWTLDNIYRLASNNFFKHNLELKSFINFDFSDENKLRIIIKSIGKKLLVAVFERFSKDYKQFHSGLPDLFLWDDKELKCCFVEVKSETDKLSTKQILWINYLYKFGAKVEVCYVEHIGSRATRKLNK